MICEIERSKKMAGRKEDFDEIPTPTLKSTGIDVVVRELTEYKLSDEKTCLQLIKIASCSRYSGIFLAGL
jgi:hypothetical protein